MWKKVEEVLLELLPRQSLGHHYLLLKFLCSLAA